MTEVEWLECGKSSEMLDFLRDRGSERKLRLFACACCRQIWHLLKDKKCRQAVELSERYADRLQTREEVVEAICRLLTEPRGQDFRETAERIADRALLREQDLVAVQYQLETVNGRFATLANLIAGEHAWGVAMEVSLWLTGETLLLAEAQCALLRDIFGNPFRQPRLRRAWVEWNQGAAWRLAESIYERRLFSELGVLADALEEAGCTVADILGHLRSPGPHVRSCWVVDLLLGKE